MKFLLDENFPLRFQRRLLAEGIDADHIILLGLRGVSDVSIRRELLVQGTVLLTQDAEFLDVALAPNQAVIVSRVPQALPIRTRIDLWCAALRDYVLRAPVEQLFELLPDGSLVPWTIVNRSPDR